MWETKGSRFIAARRYEAHHRMSTITVSLISVYIIILNLTVILENRPVYLSDQLITFSTISLSLIVLVISIFLSSRGYKYLGDKFHDCGREITKLYDELCILKNRDAIVHEHEIIDLSNKYNDIIQKYDINHLHIDFSAFKAKNIDDYIPYSNKEKKIITFYKRWRLKISSWLRFFFSTYFLYLFFISSPILVYYFVTNWANSVPL